MEWIMQHLSQLFEGLFWRSLLMRVQWVDWFTLGFVLLGIVYGSRRGLMRELVEILELILIVFLTYKYKDSVLGFVKAIVPSFTERTLESVCFIITGLFFWFLIAFADGYLQKAVHSKSTPSLKWFGGAVVGVFHFLIIWSLISQALISVPFFSLARLYEPGNSLTGQTVNQIAPLIYQAINDPAKLLPEVKP